MVVGTASAVAGAAGGFPLAVGAASAVAGAGGLSQDPAMLLGRVAAYAFLVVWAFVDILAVYFLTFVLVVGFVFVIVFLVAVLVSCG